MCWGTCDLMKRKSCRDNNGLSNGECGCNVPCSKLNKLAMIFGYQKQCVQVADNGINYLYSPLIVNILYAG